MNTSSITLEEKLGYFHFYRIAYDDNTEMFSFNQRV
jgi:hypothetical protein